MKTAISNYSLSSKTQVNFFMRKRIMSLRANTQGIPARVQDLRIMQKLQESLENETKKLIEPITEPISIIPGFQEIAIEHKLWRYFQSRMKSVENKVEKERYNFCQKEFDDIKKEVQKKLFIYSSHYQSLSKLIKDKYKQINDIFEQMNKQKLAKQAILFKNVKNKKLVQTYDGQKLVALKKKIEQIRLQIPGLDEQLNQVLKEKQKLEKEWRSLLMNMFYKGYHFKDGIKKLFLEMISVKFHPLRQHFPPYLDQATVSYLNRQYLELAKLSQTNKQKEIKQPEIKRERLLSCSFKMVPNLANQPHLKNIYSETKEYMKDWLKNGSWKEMHFLPKIKQIPKPQHLQSNDRKAKEKERIKIAYEDKQIYSKVKKLLFGIKLQTE